MRTAVVFAATLAAVTALAAGASAGPGLPAGWTHISVNVIVKGVPHTLVYDRGRIIAVGAASLTLRERDGSVWVISVSPLAQITIDGQPASLGQARRLEMATTRSVDGAPATRVSIVIPPRLAVASARSRARA